MLDHPYFELKLHDDEELEALIGDQIIERVTLHEWPLSCVQRLTLAQGRKLIYKTQYGPTVEAEVYERARSSLLPWAQTLYRAQGHTCMLIEYVDAPMFEDLEPSAEEALRVAREVRAQMDELRDDLPCYIDVRNVERWQDYTQAMLGELGALIDGGAFTETTTEMAAQLADWTASPAVRTAFGRRCGYVHRDFSADNILVLSDGYTIIDWQRPIYGPTELDQVDLLNSLGYDPAEHVDGGVVQIWLILSIGWLTEAKARWFPQGDSYDRQVAELIARLCTLARQG
jgi:Ser/Thr protein kinase RdoA (MazF antagonist)